ncbi:MAG: phage major capsid protein [Galactobacter sp.]
MATISTPTTDQAWSPDEFHTTPAEAVPDALILRASTVATTTLTGDQPVARVAYVNDAAASFVQEATDIAEANPQLAEILVPTNKIAQWVPLSEEQWRSQDTASQISRSVARSIATAANRAFLAQPAPDADSWMHLTGITNTQGVLDGGTISTDLDPLADAIGEVESNGGTPNIIIAHPKAWSALRKVKAATGSNTALLGAGTEDQIKRLLGIEVVTSPAVPEGKLVVIDPTAIISAVGSVQVASSEHAMFRSDSIAVRATWRLGWAVKRPERIATLTVGAGDGAGE